MLLKQVIQMRALEEKDNMSKYRGYVITFKEIEQIFDDAPNLDDEDELLIEEIDREIKVLKKTIDQKIILSNKKNVPLYLERICRAFGFGELEKLLLLMALSVEFDDKYRKLFSYLNDNISIVYPTVKVVNNIFEHSFTDVPELMDILGERGFLRRFILEDKGFQKQPFNIKEIRIRKSFVHYLTGLGYERQLEGYYQIYTSDDLKELEKMVMAEDVQERLDHIFEKTTHQNKLLTLVNLYGAPNSGRKFQIKHFAKTEERGVLIVDVENLLALKGTLYEKINNILADAIMHGYLIVFDKFDRIFVSEEETENNHWRELLSAFEKSIQIYPQPVFILTERDYSSEFKDRECLFLPVSIEPPIYDDRLGLWHYYSQKYGVDITAIDDVAAKFKLLPGQIQSAALGLSHQNIYSKLKESLDIYDIIHQQTKDLFKGSVTKVPTVYTWNDLVLPREQKKQFKDICSRVKHAYVVYQKWGFEKKFPYGRGISIICAGPPGTGKTMSAQVIAKELNLELFRIDLSQVISKYVGETEKKLNAIFKAAKTSNGILFFDEGDALFGKRTNIKQANDRFANVEVSYLLQKIEEYDGISIITTNFLENIDQAFLRRMQFIINFPFPDSYARKEIWQHMIPDNMPVDSDIDFEFLADNFEIAGGNIKNIVLYAAFIAAEKMERLNMRHLIYALRYELQKMDKLLLREDLKEYRSIYEELMA